MTAVIGRPPQSIALRSVSDKIADMKMPWPLASIVIAALFVIMAINIWGNADTSDILQMINVVISGVLYAELREVKANGNGTTKRLQDENQMLRMQMSDITERALSSGPLVPIDEKTRLHD